MKRECKCQPRGPLRGPWECPLDGKRARAVPRHRQRDGFLPGPCPRFPGGSSFSRRAIRQSRKPRSTHSIRLVGGRFFTQRFYVERVIKRVRSSPEDDRQWTGPCGFAPAASPLGCICTTCHLSHLEETGELSWTASSNSLPKPFPTTS